MTNNETSFTGGDRGRVVLEHRRRRVTVGIEVRDHGVVAGGGNGEVTEIEGDRVRACEVDRQVGQGLSSEGGQVLHRTERVVGDHDVAVDHDVHIGIGDAVGEHDGRILSARRRDEQHREKRDKERQYLLHGGISPGSAHLGGGVLVGLRRTRSNRMQEVEQSRPSARGCVLIHQLQKSLEVLALGRLDPDRDPGHPTIFEL